MENPTVEAGFRAMKIIWLAGFFDGEGCIYATKYITTAAPALDIATGTCFVTLGKVIEILQMLNISYTVSIQEAKGNRQKSGGIKINRREHIQHLLLELYPYLVTKKTRAAMLLSFFEKHQPRSPFTKECKRIINDLTAANSMQGGRKTWL